LKNAELAKLLAGLLQSVRQVSILKSKFFIRYTKYNIIAFPLQQWLQEQVSMLVNKGETNQMQQLMIYW